MRDSTVFYMKIHWAYMYVTPVTCRGSLASINGIGRPVILSSLKKNNSKIYHVPVVIQNLSAESWLSYVIIGNLVMCFLRIIILSCMCTFQIFLGVSGSEDRGGGDNTIQFIDIGRVGDKSFKELRQKYGGGRVGDNNILTFILLARQKCHFKKTAFWATFSIRICKVSWFIDFFTGLKALSLGLISQFQWSKSVLLNFNQCALIQWKSENNFAVLKLMLEHTLYDSFIKTHTNAFKHKLLRLF